MVEHRGRVKHDLKQEHRESRRSKQRDRDELEKLRQHDFDRMKADACRDVKVEIGVMDRMQSPEPRDGVKRNVLEINHEIENQERNDALTELGQGKLTAKSPVSIVNVVGPSGKRDRNEKANESGVEKREQQVVKTPARRIELRLTARQRVFGEPKDEEHPDEDPRSPRFVHSLESLVLYSLGSLHRVVAYSLGENLPTFARGATRR